eukprot:TRINITY_DN28010_c0_g1_i1.p1 TRINITY_DN28010_c0_g1~~TRINITY_DN28010_c0_g1_i1.p1  ORF type:complete len:528 (+),score=139.05 TRINITY_DN28010_c0_g1_i1:76-1584(+)
MRLLPQLAAARPVMQPAAPGRAAQRPRRAPLRRRAPCGARRGCALQPQAAVLSAPVELSKAGTGYCTATDAGTGWGKPLRNLAEWAPLPRLDPRVWPHALTRACLGVGYGLYNPLLPVFFASLGMGPTAIGVATALRHLTNLAVPLPAAELVLRHGTRPLLVHGPLCWGAGTLLLWGSGLQPWASPAVAATGAHLLQEVPNAAQLGASECYLANASTRSNRAVSQVPGCVAWYMGNAAGAAAAGHIAQVAGGCSAPLLCGGVALVGAAAVAERVLPHEQPRAEQPAAAPLPFFGRGGPAAVQQELLKLGKALRSVERGVAVVLLAQCSQSVMQFALWSTVFPLYAVQSAGAALSTVALIVSAGSVLQACLSPFAALLSDRPGWRHTCLAVGLGGGAVAGLLLSAAEGPWALGGAFLLGSAAQRVASTGFKPFVLDLTPPAGHARALALLRVAQALGGVLGAPVLCALSATTSYTSAIVCAALLHSAAAILFIKRAPTPPPEA